MVYIIYLFIIEVMVDKKDNLQDKSENVDQFKFITWLGEMLLGLGASIKNSKNSNAIQNKWKADLYIDWKHHENLKIKEEISVSNEQSNEQTIENKRTNLKQEIFEKNGAICANCGAIKDLDVHYVLPGYLWWKDYLGNLKVLCRSCYEKLHGYWYEIDEDIENLNRLLSNKLKLIHKAINKKLQLSIVYKKPAQNKKNNITIRVIDPINLYYKNGRQYLRAFCHLENKLKIFKVSEITEIDLKQNL